GRRRSVRAAAGSTPPPPPPGRRAARPRGSGGWSAPAWRGCGARRPAPGPSQRSWQDLLHDQHDGGVAVGGGLGLEGLGSLAGAADHLFTDLGRFGSGGFGLALGGGVGLGASLLEDARGFGLRLLDGQLGLGLRFLDLENQALLLFDQVLEQSFPLSFQAALLPGISPPPRVRLQADLLDAYVDERTQKNAVV